MHVGEKRRLVLQRENFTFVQCTLYVVFLNNEVLLERLDSINLLCGFVLSKKYLVCVCVCVYQQVSMKDES